MTESDVARLEDENVIGYEPLGRASPSLLSLDELKLQGRILDYEADYKERLNKAYEIQ